MRIGNLVMFSLLVVSLAGCTITINSDSGGVKGSGVVKTESREVDDFEKVKLGGCGTVNVTIGTETTLSITADDNLLELLESNVEDGVLTIQPSESISPKSGIKIDITVKKLRDIVASGSVSLNIEEVAGESLGIELNGASNVTGNGSVTNLTIEVNGAGSVELKDLKSENTTVEFSGASSGSVHASESVDAEINGVGSLSIYGNPEKVKKDVNGLGQIKVVK